MCSSTWYAHEDRVVNIITCTARVCETTDAVHRFIVVVDGGLTELYDDDDGGGGTREGLFSVI